jgi:outer membrane protein assembly factor BamB
VKRSPSFLIALCITFALAAGCGNPKVEEEGSFDASAAPGRTIVPRPLADWARWRGPNGDGVAQDPDFDPFALQGLDLPLAKANSRLVWKTKVGLGYSGVAVAGDFAYTLGFARDKGGRLGTDTVYGIDDRTGKTAWTYSYPSSAATYTGPRAFPLVHDGFLYTVSWDGKIFCLDALKGTLAWTVDVQAEYGLVKREEEFGFVAPPIIEGDVLIINAREWGVGLDRRTGRKIWDSPVGRSGYSPPVAFTRGGKRLVAVLGAEKLYVVDPLTGVVQAAADWRTPLQGNFADPIVRGDTILISSTYDQGYGMFRLTGNGLETLWRRKGLGAQMAAGVVIDGYYYGHDFWYYYHRGEYVCLDTATGRTMWTRKMGMGSVVAVGTYLLLMTETGRLIAAVATPAAYREIASCQLGKKRVGEWFTLPTFARSRLYVRNFSGDCFCLDLAKKPQAD